MEFKYFDWKCKLEIKVECVKRNYNSELTCACDLKLEYRSDTWSTHNGGVKERNESERESMCVKERERERERERMWKSWSVINNKMSSQTLLWTFASSWNHRYEKYRLQCLLNWSKTHTNVNKALSLLPILAIRRWFSGQFLSYIKNVFT